MNILVACEESQRVCIAFRERGHQAFSCDLLDCSGSHPEWHIKSDVVNVLDPIFYESDLFFGIRFYTCDGESHSIKGKWDMIIAFPPCTYLTVTGNRWFNADRYGSLAYQRIKNRELAINFFLLFVNANCDKIIIENPVGCMSSVYRKPDQIIHPFYFAEFDDDVNCERKATCLWLKGVPKLSYTIKFQPRIISYKNSSGTDSFWHVSTMNLPSDVRSIIRSKTFPGVAKAMASQWG